MVGIKHNFELIRQGFTELDAELNNPEVLLGEVGEILINNTQDRLERGVDIYNQPFKPLAALTVSLKSRNKDKILFESGDLYRELHYQLINGNKSLEFGSDRKYAALMHYGAKQGQFGRSSRNTPLPWGDIPAREYIGLTDKDVEQIIQAYTDMIKDGL